jgi:hypothetical protein
VRLILTNGSESWPLKTEVQNMLGNFERRILRRIYGPIKESGMRRSRYNHDLQKLRNEPDAV